MTYLEAVNKVLLRLRENEVTTVQGAGNSNQYARLVGAFINEAKAQVETAWNWSALRTTLSATCEGGVFNYELNGSQNRFRVIDVINDTSNHFMEYRSSEWFNDKFLNTTPQTGSPLYYSFNGVSMDGDTLVDIYPVPDDNYQIRFNLVLRPGDLEADDDSFLVPSRPIILLATAMAIEERGEDGGQQSVNAYGAARSALADEIALDAARHPEELMWYPE